MPQTTRPDPGAPRPCAAFPDVFFSVRQPDIALAKATCRLECPFRAQCLEAALADPDPQGVMAGFDVARLKELRVDPDKAARARAALGAADLSQVA